MAAAMALRRREAMEREHMAGEDARSMFLESRVRRVAVMRHVNTHQSRVYVVLKLPLCYY